ncbi:hypothetical protein FB451DRAFT_1182528 [Mycena latifolia]|nr:hypothetical protein FB451DRAFT_1182528 [Mycena latifolia]
MSRTKNTGGDKTYGGCAGVSRRKNQTATSPPVPRARQVDTTPDDTFLGRQRSERIPRLGAWHYLPRHPDPGGPDRPHLGFGTRRHAVTNDPRLLSKLMAPRLIPRKFVPFDGSTEMRGTPNKSESNTEEEEEEEEEEECITTEIPISSQRAVTSQFDCLTRAEPVRCPRCPGEAVVHVDDDHSVPKFLRPHSPVIARDPSLENRDTTPPTVPELYVE